MIVKYFYLPLRQNNFLQIMSEKKYQDLPNRVVMRLARIDTAGSLRRAVADLQGAWKGLQAAGELKPLPTELGGITLDWLNGIISRRTALVEKDESLTENERAERLHSWLTLKSRCNRYINIINGIVEAWPGIWQYDTIKQTFFIPDIEEVAEQLSTKDTPDEAREHWEMVQEIITKVKELRKWENEHDVITQPLNTFEGMPPKNFAELWASEDIKFNRSFTHIGIRPQNPTHTIY